MSQSRQKGSQDTGRHSRTNLPSASALDNALVETIDDSDIMNHQKHFSGAYI
jgi:hypothetical protein